LSALDPSQALIQSSLLSFCQNFIRFKLRHFRPDSQLCFIRILLLPASFVLHSIYSLLPIPETLSHSVIPATEFYGRRYFRGFPFAKVKLSVYSLSAKDDLKPAKLTPLPSLLPIIH